MQGILVRVPAADAGLTHGTATSGRAEFGGAARPGGIRCHHPGMAKLDRAEWWSIRPAQNRTPAHYTCPFCRLRLHAMTPHVLIAPEGNMDRRRHAHRECVEAARREGRLPLRSEWQALQPKPKRWWHRRSG